MPSCRTAARVIPAVSVVAVAPNAAARAWPRSIRASRRLASSSCARRRGPWPATASCGPSASASTSCAPYAARAVPGAVWRASAWVARGDDERREEQAGGERQRRGRQDQRRGDDHPDRRGGRDDRGQQHARVQVLQLVHVAREARQQVGRARQPGPPDPLGQALEERDPRVREPPERHVVRREPLPVPRQRPHEPERADRDDPDQQRQHRRLLRRARHQPPARRQHGEPRERAEHAERHGRHAGPAPEPAHRLGLHPAAPQRQPGPARRF